MTNNFYNISENSKVIDVTKSCTINIIDINKDNYFVDLLININKKVNCIVNLISMNNEKNKKEINLKINLKSSDSIVQVYCNCLVTNYANSFVKLLATSDVDVANTFIDMQINGLLDSNNATFCGIPMFKFKSNNINAKHSLNIGSINENELNYLLSKGLQLEKAKYLIISSKLFSCLNELKENDKIEYQNKILEMWGNQNVEH